MRVIAVVPARYASTRLPGKPLSLLHGKPMVQWVFERAKAVKGFHKVVVATDDVRIQKVVQSFGGDVVMTDPALTSGTDRVAAIARMSGYDADAYFNIQGDEPLIEPAAIERTLELLKNGKFQVVTLMTPLHSEEELLNPAVVKVIADRMHRALYFSRHPIPYSRKARPGNGELFACRRHVGLYGYTREALLRITDLPPHPVEIGESLEQLRVMMDGIAIGITEADFVSIGVDTPEELEKARERLGQLLYGKA